MGEGLPPSDIRSRVETLRAEIREADHRYHVLDDPTLTDSQYDELYRELVALETEWPALVDADSPTQRVGGTVAEGFQPFTHPSPMVSLDNVTNEEQFRDWVGSGDRYLKSEDERRYSVEPKIDGIGLELIYEDGVLVTAATRGDGTICKFTSGIAASSCASRGMSHSVASDEVSVIDTRQHGPLSASVAWRMRVKAGSISSK